MFINKGELFMKWIVILLVSAVAVWVYFNVDLTTFKEDTTTTIKKEKTLKKFFDADQQNKEETRRVIEEHF